MEYRRPAKQHTQCATLNSGEGMLRSPSNPCCTRPCRAFARGALPPVLPCRGEPGTPARGGGSYNAQLSRLYRDGDSWKRTGSFGRDDLLTVAKVADMAHTRIHELQAEAGDPDDAPDADAA